MKHLFLSVILLACFSAFAGQDVSCIGGDCLRYGWRVVDQNTGGVKVLNCVAEDCEYEGWTVRGAYGIETNAVCRVEGCFHDGWEVYNFRTKQHISRSRCLKGSDGDRYCLKLGWDTFQPGQSVVKTRCKANDCENEGWETHIPGQYLPFSAVCKPKGCFVEGWTTY